MDDEIDNDIINVDNSDLIDSYNDHVDGYNKIAKKAKKNNKFYDRIEHDIQEKGDFRKPLSV